MEKQKQINKLELVFEIDDDVLIIPRRYIGSFQINDISSDAKSCDGNCYMGKEIFFEILGGTQNSKSLPNVRWENNCFAGEVSCDEVIDRIFEHDDISVLCIEYEGGSEETYIVESEDEAEWEEPSDKYQDSYLSEKGDLYVVIGKNVKLESFVTEDVLNDPSIQRQLSPWRRFYRTEEFILYRYIKVFEKQMQLYKFDSPVLWDAEKIREMLELMIIIYLPAVVQRDAALLQKIQSLYDELMEYSDMLPSTQKTETIEMLKKSCEKFAAHIDVIIKKLSSAQQNKK